MTMAVCVAVTSRVTARRTATSGASDLLEEYDISYCVVVVAFWFPAVFCASAACCCARAALSPPVILALYAAGILLMSPLNAATSCFVFASGSLLPQPVRPAATMPNAQSATAEYCCLFLMSTLTNHQ